MREPDAQGCWFKSTRGVWRILANDAHHDSVVYHVGADNLGDASDIARRIVEFEGKTLRELMVYVYLEPLQTSSRIRRVRWQRERGYDTLDFAGRAPGWIVIDQVQ